MCVRDSDNQHPQREPHSPSALSTARKRDERIDVRIDLPMSTLLTLVAVLLTAAMFSDAGGCATEQVRTLPELGH